MALFSENCLPVIVNGEKIQLYNKCPEDRQKNNFISTYHTNSQSVFEILDNLTCKICYIRVLQTLHILN